MAMNKYSINLTCRYKQQSSANNSYYEFNSTHLKQVLIFPAAQFN